MSMSSQVFTRVATDDRWTRGIHPGHLVELVVYGETMVGKVQRASADNITVRIPIDQQTGDVRRFSVTGTAVISIEGAAARVPVSAQSTGEFVRLQFIGPAEIIQRRLHLRVPVSVPVSLAWQVTPGGAWSWAKSNTVDISAGGVRIAPARVVWPSVDVPVQVSIELPQSTVSEAATVIGKTPDYSLRLAFVAVSPLTLAAIDALG